MQAKDHLELGDPTLHRVSSAVSALNLRCIHPTLIDIHNPIFALDLNREISIIGHILRNTGIEVDDWARHTIYTQLWPCKLKECLRVYQPLGVASYMGIEKDLEGTSNLEAIEILQHQHPLSSRFSTEDIRSWVGCKCPQLLSFGVEICRRPSSRTIG